MPSNGERVTDWSIFADWEMEQHLSWSALGPLLQSGERLGDVERAVVRRLAADWDRDLAALGGDPAMRDMKTFRPLRLQREEDWSDWLGYLLESSATGALARRLFGPAVRDRGALTEGSRPGVQREQRTSDGTRRADIVLVWERLAVHVEVKTGDENFAKTFDTARKLRADAASPDWHDFVLLPESSVAAWRDCMTEEGEQEDAVSVITWRDVAVAVRRTLLDGTRRDGRAPEPVFWRVWAASFSALIEQKLLGHPALGAAAVSARGLEGLVSAAEVLTEGRRDG